MSILLFVNSRIRSGRMVPVAIARVNRLVRVVTPDAGLELCKPTLRIGSIGARDGRLTTMTVVFRDACCLVNMYHRHHAPPIGHLFSGAVFDGDVMCGAVIAGRPVSRHQDDGKTVELLRVVSDGTRNACSKVMSWAIKEARRRGYTRVLTYTLESESGASLRAVGMAISGTSRGGSWNSPSRPRGPDRHPLGTKVRWEKNWNDTKTKASAA